MHYDLLLLLVKDNMQTASSNKNIQAETLNLNDLLGSWDPGTTHYREQIDHEKCPPQFLLEPSLNSLSLPYANCMLV
uniref:Uncharacterized protein n=1 Tax=Gossypium raimondii TaxID=29730 RepID=A0A0D2SLG8_GOSRA|nr:hypothetical protein B456_007G168500 [Gossypium raimondii]